MTDGVEIHAQIANGLGLLMILQNWNLLKQSADVAQKAWSMYGVVFAIVSTMNGVIPNVVMTATGSGL